MSNNLVINREFNDILSGELFFNLDNKATFDQLLLNGADVSYVNNNGWNLLFEAVSLGLVEKVEQLISLGIDLNIRDVKGRNALFWAIHYKDYPIIRKLLSLGIDTKVTHSLSAINYAIYKNDVKMIKCLKNCGLDINEHDDVQSTPLIYAVLYNKIQSIDYLINNGACIVHEDLLGNSALSLAYDLKIEYLKNKFEKIIKED